MGEVADAVAASSSGCSTPPAAPPSGRPRAQCDKALYRVNHARDSSWSRIPNLTIHQAEVADVLLESGGSGDRWTGPCGRRPQSSKGPQYSRDNQPPMSQRVRERHFRPPEASDVSHCDQAVRRPASGGWHGPSHAKVCHRSLPARSSMALSTVVKQQYLGRPFAGRTRERAAGRISEEARPARVRASRPARLRALTVERSTGASLKKQPGDTDPTPFSFSLPSPALGGA